MRQQQSKNNAEEEEEEEEVIRKKKEGDSSSKVSQTPRQQKQTDRQTDIKTDRETVLENNIYRLMHVSSDSLTIYQVGIGKLERIQNNPKQSKKNIYIYWLAK